MDFNMEIFFNRINWKKKMHSMHQRSRSLPQGGIAKTKHSVNIYWLLASSRGSLQMTSRSHVKGKWENTENASKSAETFAVQYVNEKINDNDRV